MNSIHALRNKAVVGVCVCVCVGGGGGGAGGGRWSLQNAPWLHLSYESFSRFGGNKKFRLGWV